MKSVATAIGFVFIPRQHADEVGPVFADSPVYGNLSPANWERRRVYVIDPEPAFEVEVDEVRQ